VLTLNTPIGRKKRPELLNRATPLIRVKPQDLIDAGIERVGWVTGVQGASLCWTTGGRSRLGT
jgi:putative flavoprotein involved in K+ transport